MLKKQFLISILLLSCAPMITVSSNDELTTETYDVQDDLGAELQGDLDSDSGSEFLDEEIPVSFGEKVLLKVGGPFLGAYFTCQSWAKSLKTRAAACYAACVRKIYCKSCASRKIK